MTDLHYRKKILERDWAKQNAHSAKSEQALFLTLQYKHGSPVHLSRNEFGQLP